jgi:alpha-amylase
MCQDNDYNYGSSFANKMRAAGLSDSDINKVKIWESDYPKEFPSMWMAYSIIKICYFFGLS